MGWFCTTSFGGDAFQMGSTESFFTLLFSSLHLALSLTAWWSFLSHTPSVYLSLSFSVTAIAHSQSHTPAHTHTAETFVIRCTRGNACVHLENGHRCVCKSSHKSNCMRCDICPCCVPAHVWKHCGRHVAHFSTHGTCSWALHHLNIQLNADVELQLSPHTDNTFGWLFQLGLSSALLLSCTDSSFHWIRRDKAASSFLYYTHLKPLDCEKSFNAVPLRGEKNSLKKGAFVHQFIQVHFSVPVWMAFKGAMISYKWMSSLLFLCSYTKKKTLCIRCSNNLKKNKKIPWIYKRIIER